MNSPFFSRTTSMSDCTFNITINIAAKDSGERLENFTTIERQLDEEDMLFVKEARIQDYQDHVGDKTKYQITSRPKGRVLLINNEFKSSAGRKREGSSKDVTKMLQLWKGIGCKVLDKPNLNANDIVKEVKKFVEIPAEFITIVIMSHGMEDDLIIGEDRAKTEVKEIVDTVVKSRALTGKPKLLFFQMCRGEKVSRVRNDQADEATSLDTRDSSWVMEMLNDLLPDGRILGAPTDDADAMSAEYISQIPDCLIAFATMPDHKAIRNKDKGSWFIQSLAKVFAQHAHEIDVVKMMEQVKDEVKKYTAYAPGQRHHECVASVDGSNTFGTKKLFLFPGFLQSHSEE